MSTTGDLLSNAERLISDAEYLHAEGRARSAATLIVVALEQLGAFVEVLTREKYPEATVHMGIFGSNANAHAKRQDALEHFPLNMQHIRSCGSSWRIHLAGRHREGMRCGSRGSPRIARRPFVARL